MTYAYFNATYNKSTGYEGPFDVINGNSDIKMTKQLPYNPEDDLKVRIINGTPFYGRRSDFKNVSNIYFYKYHCCVCNEEALTTRHPSKWEKVQYGMSCGDDIHGKSDCKKEINRRILEERAMKNKGSRDNPRPLINGNYIGWNERKVDENGNFIQKFNKDGTKNGFESVTIFEHRVVMEEYLGRPLLPTESVHHINMNKQDNRLENLYLCSVSEHSKAHGSMNPIVETLMQNGILDFNVNTGEYYLTNKETVNV
jgi:hypothetical protein